MMYRILIITLVFAQLVFLSACSQETEPKQEKSATEIKKEPHRYGGWYCPDNFGFEPVDVQELDKIPAIAHRLPTEEELKDHKSLIKVDTVKYPSARALEMDLPRVARIYSEHSRMVELIVVIQAIVVQQDTVVGYRFANGGNGSAWISDVTFLSDDEVDEMGSLPYYYQRLKTEASTKEIWIALLQTAYFKKLANKFNQEEFFATEWNPDLSTRLELKSPEESATGFIGMVFGNFYLHIDYDRNGIHYSEKMLISENANNEPAEVYFASGPYPNDFASQKTEQDKWLKEVEKMLK